MGFDFYAPQTFRSDDGRRIIIGWAGRTVRLELSETGGRHHEIRIGRRDNGLTIRTENDRIELSFCCEKAECGSDEVSRCGGGRKRRIGRTVKCVEDLTVIIDNSIVEVFVNGGELVFTTRIYLESEERDLTVHGAGKYRIFTV